MKEPLSKHWLFAWVALSCAAGFLQGAALASTADHSQFKGLQQDFNPDRLSPRLAWSATPKLQTR